MRKNYILGKYENVNMAPTTITDIINPITSIFGLSDGLVNSRLYPHFEQIIWSSWLLKVCVQTIDTIFTYVY